MTALTAPGSALIRSLSNDSTSPFFRRFATPGLAPEDDQNLTIAEAVKGVIRSNLIGRTLAKKSHAPGFLSGQTDTETLSRSRKVLSGYFKSIMDANPERWRRGRSSYICVNPSIRAHFQLIQEVLQHLQSRGVVDPLTAPPEAVIDALVEFVE